MAEQSESEKRTDLAEDRTDWAEDRTVLANERTYAGWMRTGLASMGLGLGFNAVFKKVEPEYLAKSIAVVFVIIGILIFMAAYRNARRIVKRMDTHAVDPIKAGHLTLITSLFISAGIALAAVLWLI